MKKPLRLIVMIGKFYLYGFFLQVLFINLLYANPSNAQKSLDIKEVVLSLDFEEVPLSKVFSSIQSQTSFSFFFENAIVAKTGAVSIDAKDRSLEDILLLLARDYHLSFKQVNDRISVKEAARLKDTRSIVVEQTITGTVTDANGDPLPGVTVSVPGTSIGTATDLDGRYTLSVPEGSTLVFSFIGFESQRIEVGGRSVLDVALNEDVSSLDEVVVVGYGVQKKSHLTGAAGTVRMDETLASRPVVDFGQAIYGKIAGVQVSNPSGRPGQSSRLQIRGVNSISAGSAPLIVVDGVPLPDFDLNTINAADIESIDILKDAASAAIYGSRGANGVVLVTTKSGVPNVRTLNFNYAFTTQQAMRTIEVMNSAEYAQAAIDAAQIGWIRSGGDPNAPNTIEARGQRRYTWPESFEQPASLHDTDWQDVILRTAPMHKADVSFSGGDLNSKFYLSFGLINQEGIVIATDYNRYNINVNADAQITDWLKVGGMVNAVYDLENITNLHVLTANQYPPIYPMYGEDGYLGGPHNVTGLEPWNNILFRAAFGHPYYRLGEIDEEQGLRGAANAFAEISLLPDLKFRSSFRGFYRRNDRRFYTNGDVGLGPGAMRQAVYLNSMGRTMNLTAENLITYAKNWEKHQLDAVIGYEFNKRSFYSMSAERQNYDHDLTPYLSAGNLISGATDQAHESALISQLGRLNYNYSDKYIASVTFRRDGSSRFGPDNKWGNFPSISVGWRLSEEHFMENLKNIDRAMVRMSYGYTGNDNFSDYRWMSRMTQARSALGNNLITTYYPSNIENPDLRWERTRQLNIGLDFGFFDGRIQLEADFYTSRSDGLLLDVPVPSSSGFTSVFRNIGELQNKGLELNIGTKNVTKNDFRWTSDLIFARNRGEITKLGLDDAPLILTRTNMSVINQVGHAPFSFFAYKYLGVYKNQAEIEAEGVEYPYPIHPGMGRYKDVNGDGIVNAEDRTIIGNAQPDFTWAINNGFRWKNFDLSILIHGSVGGDVYDANWRRSMFYHEGRNYLKAANDRWRSEENVGNGYIHALTVDVAGTYEREASSYWVLDGTYTRLKDITLGYAVSEAYSKRYGLSKMRVYLNATNLFTIQNSTTVDPENSDVGPADASGLGVQHSPYPSAKTYTVGVNIQF